MEGKRTCFVIMPISDAEGYEKGHFSRVYEHLIKPACEQAGFDPVRADDTSKANMIIIDILQKILECDMAICDLSSRNPNVFYELGFRQAFNKKTILIKDIKTAMPFDISGIRTLTYNENLRIDEVKKTIPEIAKCITETFNAGAKEVNSLLQLLSIEKPAILPDKVTLSKDSVTILNAIGELNNKFDFLSKRARLSSLKLSNGEIANIGDFLGTKENNIFSDLGQLIEINPNNILIEKGGNIISINKDSSIFPSLEVLPF
jgi:hypothetical protein